jgi:hypothetical protein
MSGHRHAAVRLQGVAAKDRRLILAELPERDRKLLQAHLEELDDLGFDCSALTDALAPPATPATVLSAASRLRNTSAGQVLLVLASEPVQCVAHILSIEDWAWADALVAIWDPATRHALGAARGRTSPPPPALSAALIDKLGARLGSAAAPNPPPSPISAPARLAQRIREWSR